MVISSFIAAALGRKALMRSGGSHDGIDHASSPMLPTPDIDAE
jgi:hypothetical protein